MKRFFTLIALLLCVFGGWAKDYTGYMTIDLGMGGDIVKQEATISVTEQADGKYSFLLKNFALDAGDGYALGIGTISVSDVEGEENNGIITLKTARNITIEAGDKEGVDTWLGTTFGLVPIKLAAKIKGDNLLATIYIPYSGMSITVIFGEADGYQIPNSDFELFHKETSGGKTGDEPNHWHSFLSASGSLASLQNSLSEPHVYSSNIVRPGALEGSKSVLVKATDVFGIIANGTITTGRMNAGATEAEDTKNHAFLDLSNEKKDANGDPFYVELCGQPDALKLWVKFMQKKADETYPYATVNAVITDGTRYQDPEDKTYNNVVAKASNPKIESKGGEWQELSIPFDYATYADNNAANRAILVTMSTNATPGKGSAGDELYIDDLSLVYNDQLSSLKIKGQDVVGFDKDTYSYEVSMPGSEINMNDIEAVSNGKGALTVVSLNEYGNAQKEKASAAKGVKVDVTVFSADLKTLHTYTVDLKDAATTGITNISSGAGNGVDAVYNINGQRVGDASQRGIYIIRKADGTSVKVLKK